LRKSEQGKRISKATMMHPMAVEDYFYGDSSEGHDTEHLNLHSVALDDAEVSFPLPEEVRSASTSCSPFVVSKRRKFRYQWVACVVALMMAVITIPAIFVIKRSSVSEDTSPVSEAQLEAPRPRPSFESVVDYIGKEGISDASLLLDESTPHFKAALWLAVEDPANIPVPPFETKVGCF
jgi:hypothetical protein